MGKIKETLVSVFFLFFIIIFFFCILYFGLCNEFLIELLKKIEALLFFEIELVCGIGLCFWVCLYLLKNFSPIESLFLPAFYDKILIFSGRLIKAI